MSIEYLIEKFEQLKRLKTKRKQQTTIFVKIHSKFKNTGRFFSSPGIMKLWL